MKYSKLVALAVYCGVLSFSSNVFAAPAADNGDGRWIERICAKTPDPARRQRRLTRLAERLHLTDAQKELFKTYQDVRAATRKTALDAICASKPDLQSFDGRLAFRQRMLENRLNGMKTADPKLAAFYDALDNGQKALFDDMRRHWRRHKWHRHDGWREHGDDRGRHEDRDHHRSQDD